MGKKIFWRRRGGYNFMQRGNIITPDQADTFSTLLKNENPVYCTATVQCSTYL